MAEFVHIWPKDELKQHRIFESGHFTMQILLAENNINEMKGS